MRSGDAEGTEPGRDWLRGRRYSALDPVHAGSEATQEPIPFLQSAVCAGVNRPGREAALSPSAIAETPKYSSL